MIIEVCGLFCLSISFLKMFETLDDVKMIEYRMICSAKMCRGDGVE